jgi:hypothetical protein
MSEGRAGKEEGILVAIVNVRIYALYRVKQEKKEPMSNYSNDAMRLWIVARFHLGWEPATCMPILQQDGLWALTVDQIDDVPSVCRTVAMIDVDFGFLKMPHLRKWWSTSKRHHCRPKDQKEHIEFASSTRSVQGSWKMLAKDGVVKPVVPSPVTVSPEISEIKCCTPVSRKFEWMQYSKTFWPFSARWLRMFMILGERGSMQLNRADVVQIFRDH